MSAPLGAFPGPVSDIDPIIVTSPSIRCGTTLVQRLLCSSGEAVIWGEVAGQELETAASYLTGRTLLLRSHAERLAEGRRRVFEEGVDEWLFDLTPDVETYLQALGRGLVTFLEACKAEARAISRRSWGLKYPGLSPVALRFAVTCLPRSRIVWIHRPLGPCLSSAKARGTVGSLAQAAEFAEGWARRAEEAIALSGVGNFLLLPYEVLVGRPEEALPRLAGFCGLAALPAAALDRRINAWDSSTGLEGAAEGGYIAPARLVPAEERIVEAAEAPLRERLGALS
jgi:hypothetical protein